jgi:hypothetical protein
MALLKSPCDRYAPLRVQYIHAALLGMEVRTAAATDLPAPSCAATPHQSAAQQAALVSPTRASDQPPASLPCGCQRAQRPRTRPCARPSTP